MSAGAKMSSESARQTELHQQHKPSWTESCVSAWACWPCCCVRRRRWGLTCGGLLDMIRWRVCERACWSSSSEADTLWEVTGCLSSLHCCYVLLMIFICGRNQFQFDHLFLDYIYLWLLDIESLQGYILFYLYLKWRIITKPKIQKQSLYFFVC